MSAITTKRSILRPNPHVRPKTFVVNSPQAGYSALRSEPPFCLGALMRYAILIAGLLVCFVGCTPNKVDTFPPDNVMNPRGAASLASSSARAETAARSSPNALLITSEAAEYVR